MDRSGPRDLATRQADARSILGAPAADGWVATAGLAEDAASAHLVPLSVCWIDERLVVAIEETSRTAKNLQASPTARAGLGGTRDVVMVDAVVEAMRPVKEAPEALGDAYARQADWDPRGAGDGFVFVTLVPQRIQVWRESDEIAGRTVMRAGRWL
jgi:hypothetical protein